MCLGNTLVVANGFLLSAASGSLYYVIVEISTVLQIGTDLVAVREWIHQFVVPCGNATPRKSKQGR